MNPTSTLQEYGNLF